MSNDTNALFTMMRFHILAFGLTEPGMEKLDDAYLYAWNRLVYPINHDGADWHEAFKEGFRVTEQMMEELLTHLDEHWRAKDVPTFYQLEDHYGTRDKGDRKWDRAALIGACRYLYLSKVFDADFWQKLLAAMEHPTEATNVVAKFERRKDIYFI
jgi:hypothetical protein